MGSIAEVTGSVVYLDTNIFVYALEGYSEYEAVLREFFDDVAKGTVKAVTSELTLAEVLVKPLMEARDDICRAFDDAIRDSSGLEVMPIAREILIEAARIRSESGVRLPDAIHLATAVLSGCDSFITNDKSISDLPGLKVVYISDLIN